MVAHLNKDAVIALNIPGL